MKKIYNKRTLNNSALFYIFRITMKQKPIINTLILSFVLILSPNLHPSETIVVDNNKIIEYKGYSGQWIVNSSPELLENAIKTYSTGEKDIAAVNGSDFRNKKTVFIPFSQSYIAYVKNRASCGTITVGENEFIWPIADFDRISSSFGRRWGSFHEGIDIPAGRGIPILAVSGGRVVYRGYAGNLGHTLTIEHRENMFTRYCHCSELIAKEGDIVKQGQVIAYVGSSGNSTGNHLHFEVRYGEFPLNPLDFLPFSPCVKEAQYMKKLD